VKHKIYSFEEHGLSVDRLDHHALYVMQKLREAGFTAYLVGGSVRDLLLHKKPKDFDISTSAHPEQIKSLFKNCILIGKRFRLAHIRFGKKILEIATFRSGELESEELITRDNEWGSEEEDVLRRDFTINGLFYDASNASIIDYVDGYSDIKRGLLRTIGQPYLRFKQDPVRMIRLLKFQARFGFDVDSPTRLALLDCRQDIAKSSSARILEEILRMLESTTAQPFIRLLAEHGLLQSMMPTLAEFLESPEGEEVYRYLNEMDGILREYPDAPLDRSLLLSGIVFPLFQRRIQSHCLVHAQSPHLGEIQQQAQEQLQELFSPFFQLPRRLKMNITGILTEQYRMTPPEKKRSPRTRVPNIPDFHLAIAFLDIRSRIEPGLQQIVEKWGAAFARTKENKTKPHRIHRATS
jgi:poly(A) polymerase